MSQTTPSTGADRPDDRPSGRTDAADADDGTRAPAPAQPTSRPRRTTGLIIALAVAVAVIAALVAVIVWPDDRADDVTTQPTPTEATTTTATTAPSTTQATQPSTSAAPTTAPVDTSTAVFPDAASGARYADPVALARAFAVDFVGFTDPLVGGFMQGDARSGEVDVRPMADGPVTTVFVRQLGTDGSWWVLGSATANIAADAPAPGDAITSPVAVRGSALAFEGTVDVEVRQNGTRSPLGTGIVTGGGDVLRPFSGQITFSPPTVDDGSVVFLTRSEEDGRVWEAAVIRVGFP